MAESVDATVSNTVGATHPGSSPGPGTAHGGEHHQMLPAVCIIDMLYFKPVKSGRYIVTPVDCGRMNIVI